MKTTQSYGLSVDHHGDWSGDVYVKYEGQELVVPGKAFLQLAKVIAAEDTKASIIAYVEAMEP